MMDELKAAIARYEKASDWIDNADPLDATKHYGNYLAVIEACRSVMNAYVKQLGYNPYKNYEDLKEI
ncbi:hypothetical protein N9924_00955 [bacterium]|nr:hypothetical protein [bacterium]